MEHRTLTKNLLHIHVVIGSFLQCGGYRAMYLASGLALYSWGKILPITHDGYVKVAIKEN